MCVPMSPEYAREAFSHLSRQAFAYYMPSLRTSPNVVWNFASACTKSYIVPTVSVYYAGFKQASEILVSGCRAGASSYLRWHAVLSFCRTVLRGSVPVCVYDIVPLWLHWQAAWRHLCTWTGGLPRRLVPELQPCQTRGSTLSSPLRTLFCAHAGMPVLVLINNLKFVSMVV